MPRWPSDHVSGKRKVCPKCGGRKDFYAKACRKCTIPGKPLLGKKGIEHPAWKRGYRIDQDGYIKTYAPDHPWPRRGGYIFEHVRLMELAIGRRMRVEEVVHHINENRQDNRLDNLEIMTTSNHSIHHRSKDKTQYSRDPKTGRYLRKDVQNASE
jgi:ribosomal protein L40E